MATVLISGLGLIGSSIARVMRGNDSDIELIGSDPDDDTSQFLLDHHIIDKRMNFAAAAQIADLIVLAGPVSVIISQLKQLANIKLKPDVLVTDVGSTKAAVERAAEPLLAKGVNFVGGHPMAGSDKSGSQFGSQHLFDYAVYFLLTKSQTNRKLIWFQTLMAGADIHWQAIDAKQHDQLVSELSHVPHVIAVTLVNTIADSLAGNPAGLRAAAGGFKDTTRIAASDPTMWTAIMLSNADQISRELVQFQKHLAAFQQAIQSHDEKTIRETLESARRTRKSLDEGK